MNGIAKLENWFFSLLLIFSWGCGSSLPGAKSGGKSRVEVSQSKSLSLLVLPAEDSSIKQDFPNSNFGFDSELTADSLDDEDLLVKFKVPDGGFSEVVAAKLVFAKTAEDSFEGDLFLVASNWSEGNVTWSNAPALPESGGLAVVGEPGKSIVEVDISSIVSEPGTYSFRWNAKAGAKAILTSKDGSFAEVPKLLLDVETSAPIDATIPSQPANLQAQQIDGTVHVQLSWLESSDVSGISHYEVYINESSEPNFITSEPRILLRDLEVLAESQIRVESVDIWGLKSSATAPVLITVADVNSLPVLENPGSLMATEGDVINLQAVASDRNGDSLTYSASSLPIGLSIDAGTGLISGTITSGAAAASPFAAQVVVSDGIGVSAEIFSWSVSQENLAPELRNPGSQSSIENQTIALQLEGQDSNSDTLTYSATGLPQGLTINTATGLISGQILLGAAGQSPYAVRATVNDGSLSESADFSWTINEQNVLPTVQTPVNQSHAEGSTVLLQISASDANGDSLTYTATNLPAGLSIDTNSGLIFGEIAVGASAMSPFNSEVAVSDGAGSVTAQWSWTVIPANGLPVIQDPGVQSVVEGDAVSLQVVASDANGDTLAFSAANLPPGLSIDGATGLISGNVSVGAAANSPFTSSIIVSDGGGNSTLNINWVVVIANVAPTIQNIADQSSTEGDSVSLQAVASDTNGDTLTYTSSGLPTGLSINASTGLISGTITAGAAGASPFVTTVTVSDGADAATTSFSWTVAIANVAPTVQNIADQASAEGDAVSLQVVANDVNGDSLTYSATGLPTGLTISGTTGLISGSLSAGSAAMSPLSVSVSVSDGIEVATTSFDWVVTSANVLPAVTDPGAQASVEGDVVSLQIVATDGDGDTLVFSATGLPGGLSIDGTSGLISGTVAAGASSTSPLSAVVSVSDGSGATTTAIPWTVSAP